MISQLLIAVLCFAFLISAFALIATWTWREAKRHTVCHQLAERRSLKPVWDGKPDALPSDYDFPPPSLASGLSSGWKTDTDSTQSFVLPPKEKP